MREIPPGLRMSAEQCSTCRFAAPDIEGALTCRLNPPTLILQHLHGEPIVAWGVPVVNEDHWCGQYEKNRTGARGF